EPNGRPVPQSDPGARPSDRARVAEARVVAQGVSLRSEPHAVSIPQRDTPRIIADNPPPEHLPQVVDFGAADVEADQGEGLDAAGAPEIDLARVLAVGLQPRHLAAIVDLGMAL